MTYYQKNNSQLIASNIINHN